MPIFPDVEFLAAGLGTRYAHPLMVIAVLVIASTWLTSTLLAFGALLLAVKTRFSRRARIRPTLAKQRRVPRMLRTSYRQGLLALCCVAPYFVYNLMRFAMSRSSWELGQIADISRDLAEYVSLATPFAAAAIVPLGVSWMWMRRIHTEAMEKEEGLFSHNVIS